MISGFVDNLKLVLSDSYEISDSEYKTLSDILISNDLSDSAFDSGLVQIITLMIKYNHKFPISITFLKELWEYENISFNFVKMIGSLVKERVITLRKVKRETFIKQDNITKSNKEVFSNDIFIVVYGSEKFNTIFNTFNSILNKQAQEISESVVIGTPKKIVNVMTRLNKLCKSLNIRSKLESYEDDEVLGRYRINIEFNNTSEYKLKDSEILRNAKKNIKGKYVYELEAYMDTDTDLFLGIDVDRNSDLRDLADNIYRFIEGLELGI